MAPRHPAAVVRRVRLAGANRQPALHFPQQVLHRRAILAPGDQAVVTQNQNDADAILLVKRAPFQNNFPYTITDRQSGILLMGGEVNSLFGTVPGKIAADLVNKLRPIYEPKPNPAAKPASP